MFHDGPNAFGLKSIDVRCGQHPGEVRVLGEGFERLHPRRRRSASGHYHHHHYHDELEIQYVLCR